MLYIITTTTVLWPLYRSTCVSRHLPLRTGGFCWCKVLPHALADVSQCIRIREKTLEFSSAVLAYVHCLRTLYISSSSTTVPRHQLISILEIGVRCAGWRRVGGGGGGVLVTTSREWLSGSSQRVCVTSRLTTELSVTVQLQQLTEPRRVHRGRRSRPLSSHRPALYARAQLVLPAGPSLPPSIMTQSSFYPPRLRVAR